MKGKRGFQKGMKKVPGSGRVKGQPTLKSASVMEALNMAFEGMGGWEKLMEWGAKRPDLFYPLWIKLLPAKIESDNKNKNDNTNSHEFKWSQVPLDQRKELLELTKRIVGSTSSERSDGAGNVGSGG